MPRVGTESIADGFSGTRSVSWLRVALLGLFSAGSLFVLVALAYELALARVPQHRAALEQLVRAQTGLDLRFSELGLRWGWYGPEAVFRRVELGEPGRSNVLLRAPELVVGFDAWRTVRSGQLEAGRITLIAPDIDFASGRAGAALGTPSAFNSGDNSTKPELTLPASRSSLSSRNAPALDRIGVLQRWRGGRIDIEGGTLRLPGPEGAASPVALQIRRASLRRSDDEWSVYGLVFLPERLGRTARLVMRLNGDLGKPAALDGSIRLEAQRLLFSGCRDFLAVSDIARYLPRAGSGDVTVDLDFEGGRIVKAAGTVNAGGVLFDAPVAAGNVLSLDRVRGDWRLARHGADWRLRLEALELGDARSATSVSIDAGDFGQWVRGSVERAPLESVVAIARWLAPHLQLADVDLKGVARDVAFDWENWRPEGERLRTTARLDDVALTPKSRSFMLSGFDVRVAGNESALEADLESRAALLKLAQSPQYPLTDVRLASKLKIRKTPEGWQISTDELQLADDHAQLRLKGSLQDNVAQAGPEIAVQGTLTGADIPFVEKMLGENVGQAFGVAASRLTAGRIENAEFQLRGPTSELPFGGRGEGFTGSLILRDAAVSGGDLWPDAKGLSGRIEWRGARIQATISAGRAGAFQLASARVEWDASGERGTRLMGRVTGRIEDAVAWVRDHPELRQYAPDVQDIEAHGESAFDFNVSIPTLAATPATGSQVRARVSTLLNNVQLQAVAGLPPIEALNGSFVFDSGRLQRSTLTGQWLGGPLTLQLSERREQGVQVFAVRAAGRLNAGSLASRLFVGTGMPSVGAGALAGTSASLGNAGSAANTGFAGTGAMVHGDASWSGELVREPANGPRAPRWRAHADSTLMGLASTLPEPFSKRPGISLPIRVEASGLEDSAQIRVSLGDRLRSVFALQRRARAGWAMDRGTVRLGTMAASLPGEPMLLVQGHVSHLDLPAYVLAWQQLHSDAVPALQAQIVARELVIAQRGYENVALQASRTDGANELRIESDALAGIARWPTAPAPGVTAKSRWSAGVGSTPPAEVHFSRIELSPAVFSGEGRGWAAALAPAALVSADEVTWQGRSMGRFTATLTARNDTLAADDVQLASNTHDARGTIRCQLAATCRMSFVLDSTDAAATLADFGFRPELSASQASLSGHLEWLLGTEQSGLASLGGTLSIRLADGMTRVADSPALVAGDAAGDSGQVQRSGEPPFALLAIPALISALDGPGVPAIQSASAVQGASAVRGSRPASNPLLPDGTASANPPPVAATVQPLRDLHFARLEADFELHDGQATTSNLHFDGDAEILMRGRTGLVSRDYDQQVWVLRGEERLPAAVRRFGATPHVAALWLSLREIFGRGGEPDRSRATLHLQGSWDDPMVAASE